MATIPIDAASGAPSEPVVISTLWSTLLSVGGLLFVVGSLGFATVQMRIYEERIAELEGVLVAADVIPAEVPVEAAPVEPVVGPTPAEASDDGPTAADLRIAELETRLVQLGEELGIARDNLAGAEETITGLNSELEACRSRAAAPNNRLTELAEQNRRLRAEVARLQQACIG